jgi:hypothetical protein
MRSSETSHPREHELQFTTHAALDSEASHELLYHTLRPARGVVWAGVGGRGARVGGAAAGSGWKGSRTAWAQKGRGRGCGVWMSVREWDVEVTWCGRGAGAASGMWM